MKSKLFIGVLGVVMAVMMSVQVSAAARSAEMCWDCGSTDFEYVTRELVSGPYFAGPSVHAYVYHVHYKCNECKCPFWLAETEYEYHDYELDVSTNMMICHICGDSYQYN